MRVSEVETISKTAIVSVKTEKNQNNMYYIAKYITLLKLKTEI